MYLIKFLSLKIAEEKKNKKKKISTSLTACKLLYPSKHKLNFPI